MPRTRVIPPEAPSSEADFVPLESGDTAYRATVACFGNVDRSIGAYSDATWIAEFDRQGLQCTRAHRVGPDETEEYHALANWMTGMQLEASALEVLHERPVPVHLVTDRKAEECKAAESLLRRAKSMADAQIITGEVAAGVRFRGGSLQCEGSGDTETQREGHEYGGNSPRE